MDQRINMFYETLSRFTEFSHENLTKLTDIMHTQTIKKGDYFIKMDDRPEKFAFINDGLFRVYCISKEGKEVTLSFRNRGQFIAPYTPVLFNKEVWYYIEALTDCHIYYITVNDYKQLFEEDTCWELLERQYIIQLYREKEERERSLLMDDALTRYKAFVNQYPELIKNVKQAHIASYLGITPVSLSRIKSQQKNSQLLS